MSLVMVWMEDEQSCLSRGGERGRTTAGLADWRAAPEQKESAFRRWKGQRSLLLSTTGDV